MARSAETPCISATLPLEIWDNILSYLLPHYEVTLKKRRPSQNGWPSLGYHPSEDQGMKSTVQALSETDDMLFPTSRTRYWHLLVREATWLIDWEGMAGRRSRHDTLDRVVDLRRQFGHGVGHVVIVMDETAEEGWHREEIGWDVEEGPVLVAAKALQKRRLPDLHSIELRIVGELEDPEPGAWVDSPIFRVLLEESMVAERTCRTYNGWKESWERFDTLDNFRITVHTLAPNAEDKLEIALVEDITGLWSEGLEDKVDEDICWPHHGPRLQALVEEVKSASKRARNHTAGRPVPKNVLMADYDGEQYYWRGNRPRPMGWGAQVYTSCGTQERSQEEKEPAFSLK